MQSFLYRVVKQVIDQHDQIENHTFVLPNKRSGIFLKSLLKEHLPPSQFLPSITSIEEFMKEISGMESLDRINLIFEFYAVYKTLTPKGETEDFETFSNWAGILLQDFSEMEGNLKDVHEILSYIHDFKRIEKWDPGRAEPTELLQKYLSFYERIKSYYQAFRDHLEMKNAGYQGMIYRKALDHLDDFMEKHQGEHYVFAGFNALNQSEEVLIQRILDADSGSVYWDSDRFYEQTGNQSNLFFQKYKEHWPYYKKNDFLWQDDLIDSPKEIQLIGLPKNISQMKQVGILLKELHLSAELADTAVILGNEKLLPSLLNSIPEDITQANITMGYELHFTTLSVLFESIFKLHMNREKLSEKGEFYHKDVSRVLNHPNIKKYWSANAPFKKAWYTLMHEDKSIFISEKQMMELDNEDDRFRQLMSILFTGWTESRERILGQLLSLIDLLRQVESEDPLFTEMLFRFNNVFVQIMNLDHKFNFIQNLSTLFAFYQQILKTEKLSFQGEPLQGLQIMGLLESRVLDFKNVIITSVNEGFLPSHATGSSFIPHEIKRERNLPTSLEKDAVFAYHFFRLLHRAKKVYLLYNNITDDFGSGEPSRFIKQLEVAFALGSLQRVQLSKRTLHPLLNPEPIPMKSVAKTPAVMKKLEEIASRGFSPSSLGLYIRNPIDFYKRNILGISEYREVEETVAANTFGTIIHDTLYYLYKPLIGQVITKESLLKMKKDLDREIEKQFREHYGSRSAVTGKNYLTFEIARQFVLNLIHFELNELAKGKKIKIIALETPLSCQHEVPGIPFPIKIHGKVDRIDEANGVLRIIDYKTGKVEPADLKIKDWDVLTTEERFSKSFQVLTYAQMFLDNGLEEAREQVLESGIISFKNLKSGFMKVNSAPVDSDTMQAFLQQLDTLFLEIFDANKPFEEKEIPVFNF